MNPQTRSIYKTLFTRYPLLEPCRNAIEAAYETLKECYGNGGKVLVCGNGGSAADAEHIVGELMKGFMIKRQLTEEQVSRFPSTAEGAFLARYLQRPLPAISLVSQTSLMTAFANDVSADLIFAQQVLGYGRPGDVLLGLSTSGNSSNVLYAVHTAKSLQMKCIGMTGMDGGRMKPFCDIVIQVPETSTPEVQELHLPVYHALCKMLESEFFAEY